MTMGRNDGEAEGAHGWTEEEPAAEWVVELIRTIGDSHVPDSLANNSAFLDRCEAAGRVAAELFAIRRSGQPPLVPIWRLVDRLSDRLGIALDATRSWSGLAGITPDDPGFAAAWGRLALAVGLDRDEALFRLRFSTVEYRTPGFFNSEVPLVARTGPFDTPPDRRPDIERAVRRAIADWDAGSILALRHAEDELVTTYTSNEFE
jgi:hypothetical protein